MYDAIFVQIMYGVNASIKVKKSPTYLGNISSALLANGRITLNHPDLSECINPHQEHELKIQVKFL